ncbi:ABC transporter ATP-binding protein [bacterium]|nr:ABC transporter ATP-binding protein [bacterium]
MNETIHIEQLEFRWPHQDAALLKIPSLEIPKGERLLLKGPSGSGKSTFLNLVAGLLEPSQGEIRILGTALSQLKSSQRDQFRVDHMGFIFQTFNLIAYLSVIDNVTIPCSFSTTRRKRAEAFGCSLEIAAKKLLHSLDLDFREVSGRPVTELSVGQQQRVAAARALIGRPDIMIADEPTSALDAERRENFLNLLFEHCGLNGTTLLYVSHDASIASHFNRLIDIREFHRADVKESSHASHTPVR